MQEQPAGRLRLRVRAGVCPEPEPTSPARGDGPRVTSRHMTSHLADVSSGGGAVRFVWGLSVGVSDVKFISVAAEPWDRGCPSSRVPGLPGRRKGRCNHRVPFDDLRSAPTDADCHSGTEDGRVCVVCAFVSEKLTERRWLPPPPLEAPLSARQAD